MKETQINDEIIAKEVRVIDPDGQMLGVMPTEEALKLAQDKNLDLINVSPNAEPPVCKILDFGKYRYDLQKKEKENKKKQTIIEVREIQLSTFIDEHDIQTKANNAIKFIKKGDKLKVTLRLKGRERDYADKAREVMNDFANRLSEVANLDKAPTFEGKGFLMMLSQKPEKK